MDRTDRQKKVAKRSLVLDPDSIGGGVMGSGWMDGWIFGLDSVFVCTRTVPVRE